MKTTNLLAVAAAMPAVLPLLQLGSPPQHLIWTRVGPAPADRFATAVAGPGDIDGDGCRDVLVGIPHADGVGAYAGLAQVLSGRDGALLLELPGTSPAARFGSAVDGAGDLDGDGTPDVIVGAPYGTPSAGSAYSYSGATGALLTSWSGTAPGDRFGAAVAGLGDVDGDGRGDVAIGSPYADGAGSNAGRVEVFSGDDGSLLYSIDGSAAWDQFGHALAAASDVDGDGVGDLLIGAPFSDASGFNAGAAFLHSGLDGSLLHVMPGAVAGDWLGSDVAAAGDVDGDGVPDVVLGMPGSDSGGLDSGGAEVRSGASGALLLVIAGERSGEYAGSVSGVGDIDRDGWADLVFGAPSSNSSAHEAGRVRVISGRTGCDLAVIDGLERNDWLGAALAGVGDANGDGSPDIALGAPVHDDVLDQHGYVQLVSARRLPAPPGTWPLGESGLLCK